MQKSAVLVLVLLGAVVASEATLFEGLARMRLAGLLYRYPNLAEEIRNGQLGPSSNYRNSNNQLTPNQNNAINPPSMNGNSMFGQMPSLFGSNTNQGASVLPTNQNTIPAVAPTNGLTTNLDGATSLTNGNAVVPLS